MVTRADVLATALHHYQAGDLQTAEATYRQILQLAPDFAEAHSGLASTLLGQGKLGQAVASFLRALELNPNLPGACKLLGHSLADQGHFEPALIYLRRAVLLAPDDPGARMNLGGVLMSLGECDEALACFQQASDLQPNDPAACNNLLSGQQYRPGITLSALADAHRKFEHLYAAHLKPTRRSESASSGFPRPLNNSQHPDCTLRLGFLSPDFRNHPVSDFLIRPFEHLDANQFKTVCYYDHRVQDERTARFKAVAALWRDVVGLSDESLAEQIRADQIDILFDLAGHTANNRLLVFARKPAPIQITWIGYEGTTGLSAIDYILADRYEIPDESEPHYRERVLRMPDSYVCYEPPNKAPPVALLPAYQRGYITFGCFNNPKKINSQVIGVWANILRQLPTARLILKYNGIRDPASIRRFQHAFSTAGIDVARVDFLGHSPYGEHLIAYHAIDLALDPFPFGGGVTTCESLWMGVPVITCPGETFASRHSLSFLSSLGLTETVACDLDDYIHRAVALASDLPRLAALRPSLRQQMAASPLCDGPRFATNLAQLMTQIWRTRSKSLNP